MASGTVIETTSPREVYFGVVLNEIGAAKFLSDMSCLLPRFNEMLPLAFAED
jgi:hypothetical protein